MIAEKNDPAENNDPFESVTIHSNTAEEFLQNLDETHERWGRFVLEWVFRGQNDARWELMPSLFRYKDVHASFEIELIDNFISRVNRMNLPIPNHSLDYINYIIDYEKDTNRVLSYEEKEFHIGYDFSHIVFAIAQHSGVPTRLLDFTYNPLVAAYFAADVTQLYEKLGASSENKAKYIDKCIDLVDDNKGNVDASIVETVRSYINELDANTAKLPQNIAVWAIRTTDLRGLRETTIRLLEHPYAEILNLRLQMGVFLCDTEFDEREGDPRRSFNAELAKLVAKEGIYKFTLPFSHRPELLDLLARKRISSSYLTPSYEQVGKVVLEGVEKSHKKNEQ